MAYSYAITLLILCPMVFLAGFVDSIAGGGGLISLPAYVFAGIPIHAAYGTNKFSMCFGTGVSVVNYFRARSIHYRAALAGVLGALPGSWLGTRLAISLSPQVLQICLAVILPLVAVFMFFRRGSMEGEGEELPHLQTFGLSFLIGLVIGAYDGFFGPGTGMFITLALAGLVHLNLVLAAGTTRVINFSSNLASMLTWLINGSVLFSLALPCMVSAIAGNFIGSKLAIKIGAKFIKPVILIVAALLFIRVISDLLH
ncbi:UPF0721 transmembrane protein [Spirochaetia bacterium]|nr:UPF0721 transmembrane protein [Spirochaetia bacterium]